MDSRPPPPSPGMEWKQEGGSGLPPSPSFSGHGVEAGGWEWTPALPLLLRAWSGSRRVGVDSRPPPPSPGMEWKQEGGSGLPPSFSGHGVEAGGWEWTPALPLLLRAWSGSRRVGVDFLFSHSVKNMTDTRKTIRGHSWRSLVPFWLSG